MGSSPLHLLLHQLDGTTRVYSMLGTTATVTRAARPSARTAATSALRTSKLTSPASSTRLFSSSPRWDKQKLVILGSGWGAFIPLRPKAEGADRRLLRASARSQLSGGYEVLRKVDKKRYDVTVISPNSYFAFTPLLASASVGTIDYNSALEPVRRFHDIVRPRRALV